MGSRIVFLTGATGFIGSRLARSLAARGDTLRCLVRATARGRALEALGAELIPGEITDSIALARGLDGADVAFHLAGLYDLGPLNIREMERINVGGTRCFLEEAARTRTPRLVHVSSTAALGPVDHGEGDESSVYKGPFPSVYHRTKTEAHEAARQAQQRGLPLSIACPANVYGPGDEGPNGRFVRDLLRGRVPALVNRPSWYSYVHVDDIVHGLIAIGDGAEPGTSYVLSGEHCSVNDFARRVCSAAGRKPPPFELPAAPIRVFAAALDLVSRITHKRFTISRESVDVSTGSRWLHSHARATNDFGWTPRSLDEGLPTIIG